MQQYWGKRCKNNRANKCIVEDFSYLLQPFWRKMNSVRIDNFLTCPDFQKMRKGCNST